VVVFVRKTYNTHWSTPLISKLVGYLFNPLIISNLGYGHIGSVLGRVAARPYTAERLSAEQCGHIASVYGRTWKKDVRPSSVFSFHFTVISAEMDIDSQMYMLKTSPVLKTLLFEY
jgi:hypothetical protein